MDQIVGETKEVEETPRPLLARERAEYLQRLLAEQSWSQDG